MRVFPLLAISLLGACSAGPNESGSSTLDVAEASTGSAAASPAEAPKAVEVSLPQLAYVYTLGFRLPGDRIAPVQEAHRALCEKMGPGRCQLLALTRGGAENAGTAAALKLRVASSEARTFSNALGKAVAEAGGRTIATNVAAEDVSKSIVDTEARIRQRELLVARLTEVLRGRAGKVSELLEAERSVAQAQEELDQAKGWLAELRGRGAMSEFEISYSAVAAQASPGGIGGQLIEAVQGSGASFLIGLRALLTLLIYLAPWGLLAIPFLLVVRHFRRRRRSTASEGDG